MNALERRTDRTVSDLPTTERLFLWAIRTWAAHHDDVSPVWWSLDRAFAQERIHPALAPFDRMMSAAFAGLQRWPDIRCVRCSQLGAEEALLLCVFAQLQRHNPFGARIPLQDWLLRTAARIVAESAEECVRIVAAAGLRFALDSIELRDKASVCAEPVRSHPADLH